MKYKIAVLFSNFFLFLISSIFRIPFIGEIISRNTSTRSMKVRSFNYSDSFKFKSLKALVVNEKTFWRFRNLEKKEPETHDFLSSINDDDLLWDIGANIGQMTLSAAKQSKCKIISFEPDPANFFILQNNIFINNLGNRVIALCMPLSDNNSIVSLPFDQDSIGFSNVGRSNLSIFDNSKETQIHNSILASSITGDSFIALYPELLPTHLKIDVDGIELNILYGLKNLLKSNRLKSIIIEVVHSGDDANYNEIIDFLSSFGFKRNESRESKIKLNDQIFNIILERS